MRNWKTISVRKSIAALIAAAALISTAAACATADTAASSGSVSTSSASSDTGTGSAPGQGQPGNGQGGPGGVDPASVTSEAELVALVQSAYGEANLDLHRGHQPVQDVLNATLAISHEELHVRMEAGQNLSAVATDIGVDPQALVDALVADWSPAIDNLLANGTLTEAQAAAYKAALTESFTFRINWDGEASTPEFTGIDA